jgi:transposase
VDEKLGIFETEHVTVGTIVGGLILNGLGFSSRPLSLVPQFFENIPVEHLLGVGVGASDFCRFKTGRVLDRISDYGCERLFSEVSLHCALKAGVEVSYLHSDTTSFSLAGQYDVESDEEVIKITHGYSKDHRPDLKQVLLELLVSNDGGVPLFSKAWDGNESDSTIFQERSKALKQALLEREWSSVIIGDAKQYSKENIVQLGSIDFITRIPGNLSEAKKEIKRVHQDVNEEWKNHGDGKLYFKEAKITHYDVEQRWLICWSEESRERANKKREKAEFKEFEQITKECALLAKKLFHCEEDAQKEIENISKKWKFHQVGNVTILPSSDGKKKKDNTHKSNLLSVSLSISSILVDRNNKILEDASFIIGTSLKEESLANDDVIKKYKEQQKVERGFRFLKEPIFFASSLYLKSPARIEALLCIMSLSLLVYSLAERTLRKSLAEQNETIPNQIGKPIANPTLRWVFQCFEGINIAVYKFEDKVYRVFNGLSELREKIISCFGIGVRSLYNSV